MGLKIYWGEKLRVYVWDWGGYEPRILGIGHYIMDISGIKLSELQMDRTWYNNRMPTPTSWDIIL